MPVQVSDELFHQLVLLVSVANWCGSENVPAVSNSGNSRDAQIIYTKR